MKNKIIDTHTDRNGNIWERKIMTNFVGEKYAVLYKNGKKVEVLGRILQTKQIEKNSTKTGRRICAPLQD